MKSSATPRIKPTRPSTGVAKALKSTREIALVRAAIKLARRAQGQTSPNPLVGAILVKQGKIIGRGWHHRAGGAHAEIEALQDAGRRGNRPKGATLYVTLEPCCTQGRTPACTKALIAAGVRRVVLGATDPNPAHAGRAFAILRRAGIKVITGVLAGECNQINEAFNHWIVHRTPFVTVKAALTLDGKIATAAGQSKWITGEKARHQGMQLRRNSDAILVGVNTILADNPSLTVRPASGRRRQRFILDSTARTPLTAKVVTDNAADWTTIVVGPAASRRRVAALRKRVRVLVAPVRAGKIQLPWLLEKLGTENVTSLLVEGGGEVNASFLLQRQAQRIAFFYAPKLLGGHGALKGVAGDGAGHSAEIIQLQDLRWQQLGPDLLLTARIK